MTTWTATELKSNIQSGAQFGGGLVWRVVEHQHTASTRKLVDTQAEQDVLENLLEDSKPPYPPGTESLHYLLKTPFRYKNPHGSRFRAPNAPRGVFYASDQVRTALAETAYYRLRFFSDAPDMDLPRQEHKLTAFSVMYRAYKEIDLSEGAFVSQHAAWTACDDYSATQQLAQMAIESGVESIRYKSVRDMKQGMNVALLNPFLFKHKKPVRQHTWYMNISEIEVFAARSGAKEKEQRFVFDSAALLGNSYTFSQDSQEELLVTE